MEASVSLIKQLREETGAGLVQCKRALESTQTYEQAKEFIRLERLERGKELSGQFLVES